MRSMRPPGSAGTAAPLFSSSVATFTIYKANAPPTIHKRGFKPIVAASFRHYITPNAVSPAKLRTCSNSRVTGKARRLTHEDSHGIGLLQPPHEQSLSCRFHRWNGLSRGKIDAEPREEVFD